MFVRENPMGNIMSINKSSIVLTLSAAFLICTAKVSAQEITDTIYFGKEWQICEKPLSAYYRLGTLVIDSMWFYKGNVKDYTIEGQLVMEGNYNNDGYKDGLFNFYYPDGKLKLSGKYKVGKPAGEWRWNYPNDSLKAVVMFKGDEQDFQFVEYREKDGKIKMQNGTGDFEFMSGSKRTGLEGFRIKGNFKDGLRHGTWKFFNVDRDNNESLVFMEKYKDDGQFKKAISLSTFAMKSTAGRFEGYNFSPGQMLVTERMTYDALFRKNGDSLAEMALTQFLVNKRSPSIIMKNKKFENAMLYVLHYLERYSPRLEYQSKEINGKIEFRIGDNAFPEDISVSGTGISDKERELLVFIMNKFHNIDMPGTESMAMEGFHTINFFSINMKEFMPASLRDQVNNDLFFTTISKEKFVALLRADKRKIKRYIRGFYNYYW